MDKKGVWHEEPSNWIRHAKVGTPVRNVRSGRVGVLKERYRKGHMFLAVSIVNKRDGFITDKHASWHVENLGGVSLEKKKKKP